MVYSVLAILLVLDLMVSKNRELNVANKHEVRLTVEGTVVNSFSHQSNKFNTQCSGLLSIIIHSTHNYFTVENKNKK